jgi:hypothetical protein
MPELVKQEELTLRLPSFLCFKFYLKKDQCVSFELSIQVSKKPTSVVDKQKATIFEKKKRKLEKD